MSKRLQMILALAGFFVGGFIVFMIIGFASNNWYAGWLIFGALTIVPNVNYANHRAKKDNKGYHKVYANNGKIKSEETRFVPTLFVIALSIFIGPMVILGALIATLLGAE